MSRNKTARDSLTFISFSSKNVPPDRLRVSLARFYQHSSLRIITKQSLFDQGKRLVSLAEDARILRQTDVLEEIGERLTVHPVPQFQSIGSHYKAHCLRLEGQAEEARALFEKVAEDGPPSYRARAIEVLGTTCHDKGDFVSARKLFTEASRLACQNEFANPLAFLQSQWAIAILQSIDGDHKSSLARFEGLRPLVELAASRYPSLWFEYQNSRALELMELGRIEEAEKVSRIAIASPFARVYPEWHETARDIEAKTRRASHSVVAINCALPEPAASNLGEDSSASELQPQPSAKKLMVISDSLPDEIASRKELRDLTPDQKLSFIAKMVKALGLCEETPDSSTEDCRDPHCDGTNPSEKPKPVDLEAKCDLEVTLSLWSYGQVTSELFAAIFMTLEDCTDYLHRERVVNRIARFSFYESIECIRFEKEWRRKIENLVNLESQDELKSMATVWVNGQMTPAEIAALILEWHRCEDDATRSEITRRLVRIAFLAVPGSENLNEEEWCRKVKALVKPLAD